MITKNSNLTPSVCNIYFVLLSDITAITQPADRFHATVTMQNGKAWTELYFTPGSAQLIEKPKDQDPGDLVEQTLKFNFPGEDDGNAASFASILGRPCLVKVLFSSGISKLIGDSENGAKLSMVSEHSPKVGGSEMQFYCLAADRARWLTA